MTRQKHLSPLLSYSDCLELLHTAKVSIFFLCIFTLNDLATVQDVIQMDDDEGGILPDPAEKLEELLTR